MERGKQGLIVKKNPRPEILLQVDCGCGKQLKIIGEKWRVVFGGGVMFQCPCGEKHEPKEIMTTL